MDNWARKTVKDHLKNEIVKWQTQIDEARLQMTLGTSEVKDKLQPLINELEKELEVARKIMEEFDDATEDAWKGIQQGIKSSFSNHQEIV